MRTRAVTAALVAVIAIATGQLGAVAAVLLLMWSAAALGRLVLARLAAVTDLECLLVGLALYGTIVGLLVHLPVNYVGSYAAMLATPLLVRHRDAARMARDCWQGLRTRSERPLLPRLAGAAIAALVAVHLCVALMPEAGYDALVTHLLLPERIAWDHVWAFDVDRYVWAVMPMMGDWLYTIGYMLADEAGARLVNVGCIVLVATLVARCVRWAGGDRTGETVAVLLYLSTPLTLTESSSLFIESVWTSLLLGGALAVCRAACGDDADQPGGRGRHLAVGGLLLGGALASKAVSFMVLPVLFVVLVAGWRRWLRRACAGALVVGGLGFVALGCVPYLRAWLWTGNPVFPFYNATFRSPHYALEDFQPPAVFERGTSWDVLYRITFDSPRYLEANPGAAGFQWLLLVAPVAIGLLLAPRRRGLVLLFVAAAAIWMTFRQTAYLRYVFPSFALATAVVGVALATAGPWLRRVLLAA
ncbi:MAG: phospholipid carrier-dependent glycosyltransferase, partial [Planctomycetes bacterium]|nr:phospholipid carrier-dependent glycosyltransferase [Planctomycetota bacterium]